MPAKPVASQVCNVAPCHPCYCNKNNYAYASEIPSYPGYPGSCTLTLVVNGQSHDVYSQSNANMNSCYSAYNSETNALRRPCLDSTGWCDYWISNRTCEVRRGNSIVTGRQYCVKRV